MKVSVEKLPNSEAVLDVEITWDEMEKASDRAYRKIVQKVDVQGFRRGKAPRSIVERKLGKEYIYQEGLDDLISETYRNALKEHDLTPISQPKLDAPIFEIGQPYHFSLTVPILAPVTLGDYHSLRFEREEPSVTSEEVDKEMESLRNRQAEWQVVERPAAYEDRVTVDLKLTSGEQNISDLKDHTFELTEERYGLFSGMDPEVVGMQAGESKSFSTTIPSDYGNEKLAGKQADYQMTLHKVEEKHLPALDDEFAAKASDGQYQTLEELSKSLSDNILESKKRGANEQLREKALNAVIEQADFTVHPILIDEEVEHMVHQFEHMLENQRLSLEQYLLMTRKTREEYVQELRPDAEKRVKRDLVLDALAQQEKIEITGEDLEALVNLYEQLGQSVPRTEDQLRALALGYRRERTIARLLEIVAGPDPDAEEPSEEASIANAQAAALASDDIPGDDAELADSAAPVAATSQPNEPVTTDSVE